jgi:hypothetical protein
MCGYRILSDIQVGYLRTFLSVIVLQLLKIQKEPDGGTFGYWKLALEYTAYLSPKIKKAFVCVARDRFESEDDVDQAVRYYTQATDDFETIK